MANLAYPPCLRPGCKSPVGHPNCRCYSNVPTEHLEQAGYQRPGSTLGLKRQTNPDTGKSWYAGPSNGMQWPGPASPTEAQSRGKRLAGKFIQAARWGMETLGKIGSTYFDEGGEVGNIIGEHHHPDCPHYASGGEVDEYNALLSNPDLAVDHAVIQHGLLHLLTKTGHSRSEDPSRVMTDYIDAVRRGSKNLESKSKNIFETGKEHHIDADPEKVAGLEQYLESLKENPSAALDVGGTLPGTLPGHGAAVAAKLATVMNYANAIKPQSHQLNPMSDPIPPTKLAQAKYKRKLELLENPALLYQGVKEGIISPDDMGVVQSVYPKLFEQMKTQTTGALIDAKTQEKPISYKHRLGLGKLLGHPLDFSASPMASQAIMRANAVAQAPQQQPEKKSKKASGVELKQINQVNQLSQTPIEASQIDQKRT